MNEPSFQGEVLLSAMSTMIIYGIQLFLTIKQYQKNMIYIYRNMPKDIRSKRRPKQHDIITGSIRYPGYLLLYLLGGVFLCFHLILFLITILSGMRVIRSPAGSLKWTIELLIPALVLYFLQTMIHRWSNTFLTFYHRRDEGDVQFTTLHSILLYFNLIASE